jgi:hypothetical protein
MGKLGANNGYNGRKEILTHPHWTCVPFSTLRIVRFKQRCRALSELPWNVLQVVLRRSLATMFSFAKLRDHIQVWIHMATLHARCRSSLWDVEWWYKALLAECPTFSFLRVMGMATLLATCSLAGEWTRWGAACTVTSCNPRRRHTTLGRTPLGEWSNRRRDFNLTTLTLTRDKHLRPRRH